MKSKLKDGFKNLSLVFVGLLIGLGIAEIILRVVSPHQQYFTLVPDIEIDRTDKFYTYFNIDSSYRYTVNKFGYRAPSLFSKDRFGILAVGGSTTNCVGLSDNETWPWLLEKRLNKANLNQQFTVGNIGVPAFNSFHHVLQIEHLEPQFDNIKMVVLLVGINDFSRFLHLEKEQLVPDEKELLHQSFVRHPREVNEIWYERTELWCHLRDVMNHLRKRALLQTDLFSMDHAAETYATAKQTDDLPDLNLGKKIR